jgi:hypothetical protein
MKRSIIVLMAISLMWVACKSSKNKDLFSQQLTHDLEFLVQQTKSESETCRNYFAKIENELGERYQKWGSERFQFDDKDQALRVIKMIKTFPKKPNAEQEIFRKVSSGNYDGADTAWTGRQSLELQNCSPIPMFGITVALSHSMSQFKFSKDQQEDMTKSLLNYSKQLIRDATSLMDLVMASAIISKWIEAHSKLVKGPIVQMNQDLAKDLDKLRADLRIMTQNINLSDANKLPPADLKKIGSAFLLEIHSVEKIRKKFQL